jgi:hypothetical protein
MALIHRILVQLSNTHEHRQITLQSGTRAKLKNPVKTVVKVEGDKQNTKTMEFVKEFIKI